MGNNKMIKTAAAVALGASVVATAVAPGAASAATTYKLKSGKLVNAKTGKVVKGYKVYKSTLYKDGKKAKGYVTSGKVLYKNGKKFTGLRSAKYYKAGKVATGTYKGVYYKTGKKFTGLKSGVYYKSGVKGTGSYKSVYYKNGKKHTGLVGATYYKAGKKGTGSYKGIEYKSGKAVNGLSGDTYYKNGVKASGEVDGVQYFDGAVANGTFHSKLYVDGKVFEGTKEGKLYVAGKVFSGVNAADQKVYVDGVLDETVPAITVAGAQKVAYGASIDEASFVTSVKDNSGEEIKAVVTSNKIDTTKPGNYTVTYTATDKNGNVGKASVEVTVQAPAVESVKAINASEIQVTFKQAVDADTANVVGNYELKINDNAKSFVSVTVSKDGKTATLLLSEANSFKPGDKYVLQTNNDIKTAEGTKLAQYTAPEQVFNESAAPQLLKVSNNGTNLTLVFDRPVATATNITLAKIDGDAVDAKQLTLVGVPTEGKYIYTLPIASSSNRNIATDSTKVGTHEVILYDVADTVQGGYPAKAGVLKASYTISADANVPEVKDVFAVNANKFFIETSEDVKLTSSSKVVVTKGNYEFANLDTNFDDTLSASNLNIVDATPGYTYNAAGEYVPGVWVVVTDAAAGELNPLYKNGETSATLNVKIENYVAAVGTKVGTTATKSVTLNKDNTKPAILKEKNVFSTSKLSVQFTDDIETAPADADVIVRDKDGVIVKDTEVSLNSSDASVLDITFTSNTGKTFDESKAPYTVEFAKDKFRYAEVKNSVTSYLVNTLKNDALSTTVGTTSSNFEYSQFALNDDVDVNNDVPSAEVTSANPDADNGVVANAGDYKVDAVNGTITFKYAKEMSDSARDAANYTLDGQPLPTGSKVDFVGDKQTVRITLPTGTLSKTTSYKFGIKTTVTTLEGSKIVSSLQSKLPVEKVITLNDSVAPQFATGAKYLVATETIKPDTTTTKLELVFNEAVTVTEADALNDLKVIVGGSEQDVVGIEPATSGDDKEKKLVVTLKNPVNVNQDATITVVPEAAQTGSTTQREIAIKDAEGNKLSDKTTATVAGAKYSTVYAAELADAAAAKSVQDKIAALTSSSTQTDVENARKAYNDLSTAQKTLVTNEADLQAAEQDLVDAQAAKIIASGITTLTTGSNVLTQAQALVTAGFTVKLTDVTGNSAIASTGVVTQPTVADVTGNVIFTVSKYGKTATSTVSLTVVK